MGQVGLDSLKFYDVKCDKYAENTKKSRRGKYFFMAV